MRIIPTSIKFPPEQKKWLQTEASRQGHGRLSRVVKGLIEKQMKRVKVRAA